MLDLRRRDFITLLGGVAGWPLAARAQQPQKMRRIGVLLPTTADDVDYQAYLGAFHQGLAQSGWIIGRNVRIDTRWAGNEADEVRRHAAELVALTPDVILAHGATAIRPLLQATRTVPIVFPVAADPIGGGFVDSLGQPGGNATGFMTSEYSFSGSHSPQERAKAASEEAKKAVGGATTTRCPAGLGGEGSAGLRPWRWCLWSRPGWPGVRRGRARMARRLYFRRRAARDLGRPVGAGG